MAAHRPQKTDWGLRLRIGLMALSVLGGLAAGVAIWRMK